MRNGIIYIVKKIENEAQFNELIEDIEDLKNKYNYIEEIADDHVNNISFSRIKELSKLNPKK